MKDNFSAQAKEYSVFRPQYPDGLYDFLLYHVPSKQMAWDCGTGNGQVAKVLSKYFKTVYATDISTNQIEHAYQSENIIYKLESSDCSSFDSGIFNLITVAQAIHWFNFDAFYAEVKRTIKPGGLFAAFGYGQIKTFDNSDIVLDELYETILGKYWDPERKYLDELYTTIPFPFNELKVPEFKLTLKWSFDQLIGYLETWSAVQHYKRMHNSNPLKLVHSKLKATWPENDTKEVYFPVCMRATLI